MSDLQEILLQTHLSTAPRTDTRVGQEVQVRQLRQNVPQIQRPSQAPSDPHQDQEVQMRHLRQVLHAVVESAPAREEASGHKPNMVPPVRSLLRRCCLLQTAHGGDSQEDATESKRRTQLGRMDNKFRCM